MKSRTELGIALMSGAVAGAVALAAFLVIHAVWIVPIWSDAPGGLVFALVAGVAVGWAYDVYRVRLPARPIGRAAVVFACASLALASGLLLLPLPAPNPGGSNPSIVVLVVAGIAVLLLLITPLIAATLGALIGRSGRAAIATGLAAFTLIISLGHNIPTFGFGWRGVKMWTIMLTVNAIASVTLVVVETWTSTWFRPKAVSSAAVTASKPTR
jgi:hypothetical protein